MNRQRGVTREWVTAGRTAWKQSFPFSSALAETRTRKMEGGGEHCQRLNGYNVDFIVGLMKRHYATELRENGYKARDAVHPRRQAVCGDQICNRQGSSTLASRF